MILFRHKYRYRTRRFGQLLQVSVRYPFIKTQIILQQIFIEELLELRDSVDGQKLGLPLFFATHSSSMPQMDDICVKTMFFHPTPHMIMFASFRYYPPIKGLAEASDLWAMLKKQDKLTSAQAWEFPSTNIDPPENVT